MMPGAAKWRKLRRVCGSIGGQNSRVVPFVECGGHRNPQQAVHGGGKAGVFEGGGKDQQSRRSRGLSRLKEFLGWDWLLRVRTGTENA